MVDELQKVQQEQEAKERAEEQARAAAKAQRLKLMQQPKRGMALLARLRKVGAAAYKRGVPKGPLMSGCGPQAPPPVALAVGSPGCGSSTAHRGVCFASARRARVRLGRHGARRLARGRRGVRCHHDQAEAQLQEAHSRALRDAVGVVEEMQEFAPGFISMLHSQLVASSPMLQPEQNGAFAEVARLVESPPPPV